MWTPSIFCLSLIFPYHFSRDSPSSYEYCWALFSLVLACPMMTSVCSIFFLVRQYRKRDWFCAVFPGWQSTLQSYLNPRFFFLIYLTSPNKTSTRNTFFKCGDGESLARKNIPELDLTVKINITAVLKWEPSKTHLNITLLNSTTGKRSTRQIRTQGFIPY